MVRWKFWPFPVRMPQTITDSLHQIDSYLNDASDPMLLSRTARVLRANFRPTIHTGWSW